MKWASVNTEATIWPKYQTRYGKKLPWLVLLRERWLEPGTYTYTRAGEFSLLEQAKYSLGILGSAGWGTGGFHFPFNSHCKTGDQFQHAPLFLLCCLPINVLSVAFYFQVLVTCLPSNAPALLSASAQYVPCQAHENSDSKVCTLFSPKLLVSTNVS